jgi:hypothetical protein
MDSATFSSAPKDLQLSEFAISGLYEDLLVKQYGESMVSDVTKTRDLILVLLAKSVENREQAVHLSKQCFGEKALEVMTTFQQRLAEANKAPKKKSKSKKSSSSSSSSTTAAAAAATGAGKVVVKLEAGDSNVVEMLSVDDGAKKKSKSASASSANVTSSNEKSPQTDPKPASPVSAVAVVPEVVALTSESKKTKSSGKKRKVGDSESEA